MFACYLIKQKPSESIVSRYQAAVKNNHRFVVAQDMRVLQFAVTHPRFIGLLDGGLAVKNPNSELRRRLFVMFALLETTPDYYELFVPQERKLIHLPSMLWTGFVALCKAFFGILTIRALQ